MDAIFIDAKKWGGRGEGLMLANCFREKLGKVFFVCSRCKSFNTLRRRQHKRELCTCFDELGKKIKKKFPLNVLGLFFKHHSQFHKALGHVLNYEVQKFVFQEKLCLERSNGFFKFQTT
jgi:hypothetical protein